MRTLTQIGQRASLAITHSSLNLDICCVSKTRIQDSFAVLQLSCPNSDNKYFLRLSGDDAVAAAGRADVSFAHSSWAHKSLIDWIPVKSRMCAARFSSSVKVGRNRSQKRTLYFMPQRIAVTPIKMTFMTIWTAAEHEKTSDIVIVADYNAQLGKLTTIERLPCIFVAEH